MLLKQNPAGREVLQQDGFRAVTSKLSFVGIMELGLRGLYAVDRGTFLRIFVLSVCESKGCEKEESETDRDSAKEVAAGGHEGIVAPGFISFSPACKTR